MMVGTTVVRRACRYSIELPSNRLAQHLRHPRELTFAHLREERQRQRALGDVLTDRKLALAMAEALAVEAHQMDGREVGLTLDLLRRKRADRRVAIHAVRELHNEHEPAAFVSVSILARQAETL